ncbi:beta-lactamase family protein [Phaeobacter inhibens]|uniref:serine hydrolase domain-containing protein n=1 Tax=Phaeobacter inhibens TaxID=221822 RepID=UPI0021A827D8|nr:serine hydrolase domain-containing protein [Phaeobacter inhibens]UWR93940.1 beta-lactamase family protein [Phaeobacter inhibens]
MDAARLEHIRTWQHRYVDQRKYAGSSLLINRNGKERYFQAAGQRNIVENLPFTRDTVARIYSMTKPVTSLALMMLLERGVLHLDMSVSEFLPEFNGMRCLVDGATDITQTRSCRPPTLHELLTHTSGLSYPFNPGVLSEEMSKTDLMFKPGQGPLAAQVLELAALPLAFEPGQRWEYSVGIDVIGRVIEIVTGESLGAMLKREIFDPLGMARTGFRSEETTGNLLASLYSPLSGDAMALNDAQQGADSLRLIDSYDDTPFDTAEMHSGGGGLLSTIDDYMRFAELIRLRGALGKDHLISPQIIDFMCQNHLPGDIASMGPQSFAEQPMDGMGFGLGGAVVLDPARARCPGSVGDFSWGGMASTFFWVDPVLDLSVVFFTQLAPSSSYPSRAELKALVHGAVTS